jgi:hypothetical protein
MHEPRWHNRADFMTPPACLFAIANRVRRTLVR